MYFLFLYYISCHTLFFVLLLLLLFLLRSGTGSGGQLLIQNSRIEKCSHEGIAISDNGWGVSKSVIVKNTIVSLCQQGIELGFSTHLLRLFIYNTSFIKNSVGLRVGDNYGWATKGHVVCEDCLFVENSYQDVLNLHRSTFMPVVPTQIQLINSFGLKEIIQNKTVVQNKLLITTVLSKMLLVPNGCIVVQKNTTLTIFKKEHKIFDKIINNTPPSSSNNIEGTMEGTTEDGVAYLNMELDRNGVGVPFTFPNTFSSETYMRWYVADRCSSRNCTLLEYEEIIKTLKIHCSIKNVSQQRKEETHILILWSNVPKDIRLDIDQLLYSNTTNLIVMHKRTVTERYTGKKHMQKYVLFQKIHLSFFFELPFSLQTINTFSKLITQKTILY